MNIETMTREDSTFGNVLTQSLTTCKVCGTKMVEGYGYVRGEVGEKGKDHAWILAEVKLYSCPECCDQLIITWEDEE